jgi:hypothetical protein
LSRGAWSVGVASNTLGVPVVVLGASPSFSTRSLALEVLTSALAVRLNSGEDSGRGGKESNRKVDGTAADVHDGDGLELE